MTSFAAPEYLWLVVVGSMAAFAFGWGTGSNDVANAFGTSVGAKTLTLKQAVVIAICFEFTGALVLGRVSTSTIAGGIAQISFFQREPEIYAYGMVCALSIGFFWQAFASYMELNVSATHSIIGAIIGFSLCYGGGDAVNWATKDSSSFPPVKGVVPIILSWFVSPVLTGLASAFIFATVRTLVLRRKNSYNLSFWVLPVMVLITSWVCIYFVLTKGAKKLIAEEDSDWTDAKAAWIAAACAGGLCFLCIVVALPLLKWRADKKFAEREAGESKAIAEEKAQAKADEDDRTESGSKFFKAMSSLKKAAMHGMEVDIHEVVTEDPIVAAIHKNAEVFDPKTEYAFSYLQVFSAICVIFAHGAGEVGYMAGPLATIWFAVKDGVLYSKVNAPIWCILISAFGLVIGLATYGYNVTRAMGTKMAKLSPSRGFAAELSTALVIMIASQYGLPTSSSQCITGGIIGLGCLEGKAGVNWKFFAKTFASWAGTLVVVGVATAALFSQGVYAPSVSANKDIYLYENNLIAIGQSIAKDVNTTLFNFRNASLSGNVARMNATQWSKLNSSIVTYNNQGKTYLTPKTVGTLNPDTVVTYLQQGIALMAANSLVTLGQNTVYVPAAVCNDNSTVPANGANCTIPRPFKALGYPYNATTF